MSVCVYLKQTILASLSAKSLVMKELPQVLLLSRPPTLHSIYKKGDQE